MSEDRPTNTRVALFDLDLAFRRLAVADGLQLLADACKEYGSVLDVINAVQKLTKPTETPV